MNKPITIVLNTGSGYAEKEALKTLISETLQRAGRAFSLMEIGKEDHFSKICTSAVQEAATAHGIIVAAGGDGTVSALAALCLKHKVLFGVIPLGTFNYFAREWLIPTDTEQAIEVLINAEAQNVSVGFVQERMFLNNASFGLYTNIIRNREADNSRYGRLRIVAAFSAIASLFKEQKIFTVRLTLDGKEERRRTSMVFVGNNTLQLENLGLESAHCTAQNSLAVIIMKPLTRWQTARLLLLGAFRQLKAESQLEEFCADSFEVESSRKSINLVVDGEIIHQKMPLSFRVEPQALQLIAPLKEAQP